MTTKIKFLRDCLTKWRVLLYINRKLFSRPIIALHKISTLLKGQFTIYKKHSGAPLYSDMVLSRQYWNRRKMGVSAILKFATAPLSDMISRKSTKILWEAMIGLKGSVSRDLRWVFLYINRKLSLRPIIAWHKILSLLKGQFTIYIKQADAPLYFDMVSSRQYWKQR